MLGARGHAAVIGGGTMGAGIASVLAKAGIEVELIDVSEEAAAAGIAGAREMIDDSVARGRITPGDGQAAKRGIKPLSAIADATPTPRLAIEAVPERFELKTKVLAAAERLDPKLLATNTSGISIDDLAAALSDPSRFIGLHFFNPVPAIGLVEVVLGSATDEETRAAAIGLIGEIGKEAVVVKDAPGFASSRLGIVLGLEAIRMVEQGIAGPEDIDRAMVLGYRHPVGPLRLTDLIGLDVRLDIARNLEAHYGDRFAPPPLLEEMVSQGRLGKKSGQGFYRWE
ncbi:MAG: 3-hydroxyacyl-CoA dehydrogenase family protein [Solirubrobacterales bacterium]